MTDANAEFHFAGIALVALATFGFVAAAVAQEMPEGQTCGGLVCDLGLFGHKTAPKPSPSVTSSPTIAPVTAPARTAAEPELKRPVHKRVHVAKASALKPAKANLPSSASMPIAAASTFGAPPVASALVPVPASVAPAPLPVAAALAPPPSFAVAAPPSPAPIPVTATPARDEPVVLANPYVYNKPLKFMFQSVDPTQGVQ